MKKLFSLMLLLATMISFIACGDDDKDGPSLDDIVGTWELSKVSFNDGENYMDWPFETTTASFRSDGTYYGRGYFGTGSGTWKQKGKTIITYVDGEEYIRYEVKELTSSTCTLVMSDRSGSVWIKCVKQ